jgi:cysteinyl-tRNA synthetase
MAMENFQMPFDIHMGGRDLIFPHHTNENAQGYGICGKNTANYWIHTNFINVENAKMSKSSGTSLYLIDVPHHPMIVKLAFLMTNYKQEMPWSDQILSEAQSLYNKWRRKLSKHLDITSTYPSFDFIEAMTDDFNTPLAIRVLDRSFEDIGQVKASFDLLGITFDFGFLQDKKIQELVTARTQARKDKDFALADSIRDQLTQLNVDIEELPNETFWYQRVD